MAIGKDGGPCFRAKQNGDNQSPIHVDFGYYADALLRKSEFDERHMTEAGLAMRDVMSREEEPSFVIRDPI